MNDLLRLFKENIEKERLFHARDILLVAASGGIDSVVLCDLCRQSGFQFIMAHCNFQLRSKESERDEIFVKAIAQKYGARLFIKRFDTERYILQNNTSVQVRRGS